MQTPISTICKIALSHPERIALVYGDTTLSYGELVQSAADLAVKLKGLGVKPGSYVALLTEKNPHWYIAMLAVQFCDAAYIPLDVSYPAERIAYCIENTGATLVLTDSERQTSVTGKSFLVKDLVDGKQSINSTELILDATEREAKELPAYVIYTSGSTGKPKGVVVSQRALAFHMDWMNGEFRWTADDVFIQKSSISFDASVWEYFAPLMSGASCVISDADPSKILENLRRHKVSVAQFVPTVLRYIKDTGQASALNGLRLLFSGGEAISKELADTLISETHSQFVNLYGPTETTIQCSFYRYSIGDIIDGDYLPIGQVLPGITYEIANAGYHGSAREGELIISGPNVASGYINNDSATREKFEISQEGIAVSYRTGDIVRIADDGMLYFIGRNDQQIKLRGLRIEKDEIAKTALAFSDAVRSLHIGVINEDTLYMWLEADNVISDSALRDYMGSYLPSWMIPSRFITLKEFPSLPNGKLDVNSLMAIRGNVRAHKTPLVNAGLEKFRQEWISITGTALEADADLIAQGVNSLHCIRAAKMILDTYQVKLPSSEILSKGSLSTLYETVCSASKEEPEEESCESFTDIPLSEEQQGILFSALNDSDPLDWELHYQVVFKEVSHDDISAALKVMAQRHPVLRASLKETNQTFYQHISPLGVIAPIVRENEQPKSVGIKAIEVTDNALWKIYPLKKPDEYLFIFHHIIFDGFSADVFFNELSAILSGEIYPEQSDTAFLKYCSSSAAGATNESLTWWENTLSAVGQESRIAPEFRSGTRLTSQGDSISIELPAASHDAIDLFSRQVNMTPFTLLLTATCLTLSDFIQKDAFCIGVPVYNRSPAQTESLGNFVKTLPVPFSYSDDAEKLLKNVSETFTACLAHADISVQTLIHSKVKSRGTGSRPLWQNNFVFNESGADLHNLEWSYSHRESPKADTSFVITRTARKTTLRLEYCTDVVSASTADAMIGAWSRALATLLKGKLSGKQQSQLNDETSNDSSEGAVADPAYLAEVLTLFKHYLGEFVNEKDDFFLSGGHSLLAIRILNELGKLYDKHLPSYLIFEGRTANNIAVSLKEIIEPGAGHRVSGVARLTQNPEGQNIWFIHPAGGALWCYKDLAERVLAGNLSSYGIECVPEASTGQFVSNLNTMAERYCLDILDRDQSQYYTIVGYSFGGNVAYEICRLLSQKYDKRCRLVLLDSHICAVKPFSRDDFALSYATKFTEGKPHLLDKTKLYLSDGSVNFSYIKSIGVGTGHITADTPLPDIESGLRMWLANNEAVHSHDPVGVFKGECLFIRATRNPSDSTSGWEKHLTDMKRVEIDAGHFDIYKPPATQMVAEHIVAFVNREFSA